MFNFGDIGKMGTMLKQAMEVKARMEELKESLGNERIEAAAGGGMVQVIMTGKMELLSIKIDPEIINPADPQYLETLVQAAFNDGIYKAQDLVKAKMTEMTGGIDIPRIDQLVRTVFFGTPDIAVPSLQAIEALHEVTAVVCQPDKPQGRSSKLVPPPVKVAAEKLGIPVHQPTRLNDGTFEAWLRAQAPEVCTIAAYGRMLRQPLLDIPTHGWLNMHPSLLPKYRGPSPIQSAILNGDTVTGVSIMRLVLAMDAGDVLLQEQVEIGENENAVALAQRLGILGAELMFKSLRLVEEGTATFTPQDPAGVVECNMFEKNDGRIRWAAGARTIHNLVRAAQPWPIAHCALGGEIHRIHETRLADGPATAAPGAIEEILKDRILVATGEGRIAITQIQAPGKRVMAMGDFLRGHKLDAGVSFTDLT